MKRYVETVVGRDLTRKMVFVGGARQVGKTTLARRLLRRRTGYLCWDVPEHRSRILRRELPDAPLWAFDEIHKYRSWRNYLKGLFDEHAFRRRILVTGSARLDLYRRGGDSLQGRYHYIRLHPLSAAELGLQRHAELMRLLSLGGFPEPCLAGSQSQARRWSRDYQARLVREEVAGLERVQDLGNMELLATRLPELVGAPLSINALREDLRLAHATVANWLDIFERLYSIFRLSPFGAPRIRAVRKEQKHYHFDWSIVPNDAARFENLVAAALLKWVHYQQDAEGRDVELRYFRDTAGREVDFVVTERRRPIRFVECKWSDGEISPSLRYIHARFPEAEALQIAATGDRRFVSGDGIRVCPALDLLSQLI